MTDKEEIKKALECHSDEKNSCEDCTFWGEGCSLKLCKGALDLINRQQAEIENYSQNIRMLTAGNLQLQARIKKLKKEREVLVEDIHSLSDQINEQLEEIENLTINMNAFGLGMKREKERADTIRAEAIKEFARALRQQAFDRLYVSIDELDNLVKEMEG